MDVIPEFWPTAGRPEADLDERPIAWLGLPIAMIVSLIRTRRSGPRVAATSWVKVLALHAIGLTVALIVVAVTLLVVRDSRSVSMLLYEFRNAPPSEAVRLPFAWVVNNLYEAHLKGESVWGILLVPPAVTLIAWPVAIVLMPLLSAGERFRVLCARTVRLSLWASIVWIPGVVPVALALSILADIRTSHWISDGDAIFFVLAAFGLILVTWLVVIIQLGIDCTAPPEQLAWEPRIPRCEGCGYCITGLAVTGQCSECGRPIADSMPDHRREPAWALANGFRAHVSAYFQTHWSVLHDPQFFSTLAVFRGRDAALRFAGTTACWVPLVAALSYIMLLDWTGATFWQGDFMLAQLTLEALSVAIVAAMALFAFVAAFAWLASRLGRSDPRPVVVAACYGVASLTPTLVTIFVLSVCWFAFRVASVGFRGLPVVSDVELALILLTMLWPSAMLILGARRLSRAVNGVKIANG